MKSSFKSNLTVILSVVLLSSVSQSATPLPVIDISGGEDHTLVLGQNGQAFACGDNTGGGYTFGVLGTGNNGDNEELTLVRVHGPNDIYILDDICDVDAGWQHSLALDVNGMVWAWGDDDYGHLGNGAGTNDSATPVRVLSGQQDPNNPNSFLRYIIQISAGRSGEHSLAVDANNFCYAWGYNEFGQLGNDEHGLVEKENTAIYVQGGQMGTS